VEANSTGGQGLCRAVAPSDDDDDDDDVQVRKDVATGLVYCRVEVTSRYVSLIFTVYILQNKD
jgi:hypothetical protein